MQSIKFLLDKMPFNLLYNILCTPLLGYFGIQEPECVHDRGCCWTPADVSDTVTEYCIA